MTSNQQSVQERLLEWLDTPIIGRMHMPYANPTELKADMRSLLEQYESLKQERDLLVALDEIEPVAVLRAERDGLKEQLEALRLVIARQLTPLDVAATHIDILRRKSEDYTPSERDNVVIIVEQHVKEARAALFASISYPATKPELDVDDPQGFYDAVPDPAKGHNSDSVMSATPGPSPASDPCVHDHILGDDCPCVSNQDSEPKEDA